MTTLSKDLYSRTRFLLTLRLFFEASGVSVMEIVHVSGRILSFNGYLYNLLLISAVSPDFSVKRCEFHRCLERTFRKARRVRLLSALLKVN